MKKVKKFAWFPTTVITKFEDNIMIFETIWLRNYYQYYELRGRWDGDYCNDCVDWIEEYVETVKKLF